MARTFRAACFYSGRNVKSEALGRSAGPVQNVIMVLPHARSWRAIREELKDVSLIKPLWDMWLPNWKT